MSYYYRILLLPILFLFFHVFSADSKKKVVFQDFENGYGKWVAEGSAFKLGSFPVDKFLSNNRISGYQGKYIVNTYNSRVEIENPDQHTGTLTSPEFIIKKKFITFLIAGGNHPNKVGIKLFIEGKEVLSFTGYGSLDLEEEFFDTKKYMGKKAKIQIFDNHTGGWGFIAIDNITFTDEFGECSY